MNMGMVKKEGAPKLYTFIPAMAQNTAFTIHAIHVAAKGLFIRIQIPYRAGSVTPARKEVSAQDEARFLFFVFSIQANAMPNWEKFMPIKAGNIILSNPAVANIPITRGIIARCIPVSTNNGARHPVTSTEAQGAVLLMPPISMESKSPQ